MSKKEMEIIEQRFDALAQQISAISDMIRVFDLRVSAIEAKGKAQEDTAQKTGYVSPWDAPRSYRLGMYNG